MAALFGGDGLPAKLVGTFLGPLDLRHLDAVSTAAQRLLAPQWEACYRRQFPSCAEGCVQRPARAWRKLALLRASWDCLRKPVKGDLIPSLRDLLDELEQRTFGHAPLRSGDTDEALLESVERHLARWKILRATLLSENAERLRQWSNTAVEVHYHSIQLAQRHKGANGGGLWSTELYVAFAIFLRGSAAPLWCLFEYNASGVSSKTEVDGHLLLCSAPISSGHLCPARAAAETADFTTGFWRSLLLKDKHWLPTLDLAANFVSEDAWPSALRFRPGGSHAVRVTGDLTGLPRPTETTAAGAADSGAGEAAAVSVDFNQPTMLVYVGNKWHSGWVGGERELRAPGRDLQDLQAAYRAFLELVGPRALLHVSQQSNRPLLTVLLGYAEAPCGLRDLPGWFSFNAVRISKAACVERTFRYAFASRRNQPRGAAST